MKLWKITQNVQTGYDTYDSAVVAAETEDEARVMHPSSGKDISAEYPGDWASKPEDVTVEYLGEAGVYMAKQVVCASYNAG